MNLPSIPKIHTLGNRENHGIFEDLVQVEEKIDGSQFSFGKVKRASVPGNPGKAGATDIVDKLTNCLRTEARWLKAIQHLREAGKLENANKDIGPLCREIQSDILAEETDWIKQRLFEEFSKEILNGCVRGFAPFYQKLLAEGPSVYQEEYQLKPTPTDPNRCDNLGGCTCDGNHYEQKPIQ